MKSDYKLEIQHGQLLLVKDQFNLSNIRNANWLLSYVDKREMFHLLFNFLFEYSKPRDTIHEYSSYSNLDYEYIRLYFDDPYTRIVIRELLNFYDSIKTTQESNLIRALIDFANEGKTKTSSLIEKFNRSGYICARLFDSNLESILQYVDEDITYTIENITEALKSNTSGEYILVNYFPQLLYPLTFEIEGTNYGLVLESYENIGAKSIEIEFIRVPYHIFKDRIEILKENNYEIDSDIFEI